MSSDEETQLKNYIQKYADKHNISFEEAAEHAMCKAAELMYGEDKNHERNNVL